MLKNPYIEIIRPNVCILAVLAYTAGALLVNRMVPIDVALFFFGFMAVWFICAGGNVINDYFDRHIDAINRAGRPIPSGRIKPKNALVYYFFLNIIALLFAIMTTIPFLLLAVVNVVVSFFYSFKLKRTFLIGNVVDSYLASVCFIAPLFLISSVSQEVFRPVLTLGSIAFFGNLSREMMKDVEDMKGDGKMGARTLAIVVGKNRSMKLAKSLLLLAAMLGTLPLYFGYFTHWYLIGYLPALFLILSSITDEDVASAQRKIKIAMFSVLAGFLIGSL